MASIEKVHTEEEEEEGNGAEEEDSTTATTTIPISEENRAKFAEAEAEANSSDLWARLQNIGANSPEAIQKRQKQHHTPIELKERRKRAKAKAKKRAYRTDDGACMLLPDGGGGLRVAGTDIHMSSGAVKGYARSSVKRKDYEDEEEEEEEEDSGEWDYEDVDEEDDCEDSEYYYYYYNNNHRSTDQKSSQQQQVGKEGEEYEDLIGRVEGFIEVVKETLEVMGEEERAEALRRGEDLSAQLRTLIENGTLTKEEELAGALDTLGKLQDVLAMF